jgi:hypothetical protein
MNNYSSTGSQVQGSSNASQWAGVHFGFYQASAMQTCILLDNESSATISCNPDMVTNIWQTDKELTLTTNAGVLQTKMKANVLVGVKMVWSNSHDEYFQLCSNGWSPPCHVWQH